MSSRENILARVRTNQPPMRVLPGLSGLGSDGINENRGGNPGDGGTPDLVAEFSRILEAIGGESFLVSGADQIIAILRERQPHARRIVSGCPELRGFAEPDLSDADPHRLENVDLAVLQARFGVAENGACWITENEMLERALPFITQHLALVIGRGEIVKNMHAAYERIADDGYGFGTFIAGPSKTADIEQSLVLGAHGPASLTVFLVGEPISAFDRKFTE